MTNMEELSVVKTELEPSETNSIVTLVGIRSYGPNVVRAILVSGEQRWLIIGACIHSSDRDMM